MRMQSLYEWLSIVMLAVMASTVPGLGASVHVALDGDNLDGLTWATALTNIQAAVNDSNATNGVWIKAGVYAVTNQIMMSNNVAVYGGFYGNETDLAQRGWRTNATVISNTVVASASYPTQRVFNCDGMANWRLDGLTIRNGSMLGGTWPAPSDQRGGGIRALDATGNCYIANCFIRDNGDGRVYGGGLSVRAIGTNNIYIQNTVFSNNNANTLSGGSIFAEGTGLILLQNCMFVANTASYGAGIRQYNSWGANSGLKVVNCVFYANRATQTGSGITIACTNALIANCVFMTNTGPAAIYEDATNVNPQVQNCLFQKNSYVYKYFNVTNSFTTVDELNAIANKTNNIAGDPLFLDPVSDFRNPGSSPLVDHGTNANGYAPATDYYGNARPIHEYDIGIYEGPFWNGTFIVVY